MGSFVPGFDTDVFISYAHEDDKGWVKAFEEELSSEVSRRLGITMACWRDTNKLRAGEKWEDSIRQGIERSAAFVAIVSPIYQNSRWCGRERQEFIRGLASQSSSSKGRFFKAVKTPWLKDGHSLFLPEFQAVSFYKDGEDGSLEFSPGSRDFKRAIRKLADGLEALLRRMRSENQRVHVAWPAEDCLDAWRQLNEELRIKGFDVQPMGPRDSSYAEKLLREDLEQAVLSVHMLGKTYDEFTERIALLAADLESPMLFWLGAADGTPDARQKALIESVRGGVRPDNHDREWPRGWSLNTDATVRRFIDAVLTKLRPPTDGANPLSPPAPSPPGAPGVSTVYIVHDATTPEDSRVALDIKDQISQIEKMNVFVSRADLPSPTELKLWHEQLLRSCDGVLLYRNLAPEGWWNQLAPEIIFAERRFEREPLKSRAFLLPQAPTWDVGANVTVLPYRSPFQLGEIESFLNPLRASAGHDR